jgi:CRP/FNR family cyclic AMP-dependent transcriptional regulator
VTATERLLDRQFFAAGTAVFQEGDAAKYAYLVQTGRVEISRKIGQHIIVLDHVTAGGIFGEMALLDEALRSASAVTLEDTTCVLIHEHEMQERLERCDPFIRGMLRILIRNIRQTNRRLGTLAAKADSELGSFDR